MINTDNMQTYRILVTNDEKLLTRLRHVDIHNLWVKQQIQNNVVKVKWIRTLDMVADGMTKILPRQKHEDFVKMLNLKEISV